MTAQELNQLAGLWAMYAGYYRMKLDDQVLRMYADDLADFDFAEVRAALDVYRKNPKNRQLPMPSQIREIIKPEVDPDSAAREVAARITAAIPKFGWCNSQEARAYIGETGWDVVERQGGWSHICQNHGITIDPTSFQAQVRDIAKASIQFPRQAMAKAIGVRDMPAQITEFVGGLVKTIDGSCK